MDGQKDHLRTDVKPRGKVMQKLLGNIYTSKYNQHFYKAYNSAVKPIHQFLFKLEGMTYADSGLICNKNTHFLDDPKFKKAYRTGLADQYKAGHVAWNMHILHWAVMHAKNLGVGDFVECGVYKGMHAMSNMVFMDFKSMSSRRYYLFDTYGGLDKEFSSEKEFKTYEGKYENTYEYIIDRFKDYPNAVIVKGAVPRSLETVPIKNVAYVAIDMNCAPPEKAALEFFWPKIVPGGIIVLDDYGNPGFEELKKDHDEFAKKVGTMILALPTGQGIIIKQ